MNANEKAFFVNNLVNTVVDDVLEKIKKAPPEWDGHELRLYLAERFGREVVALGRKREREYHNTVAVQNL